MSRPGSQASRTEHSQLGVETIWPGKQTPDTQSPGSHNAQYHQIKTYSQADTHREPSSTCDPTPTRHLLMWPMGSGIYTRP